MKMTVETRLEVRMKDPVSLNDQPRDISGRKKLLSSRCAAHIIDENDNGLNP